MHIIELWQKIETQYGDLSPRLREAASWVRANPAEIALHGLRRSSREAALSSGALLRLVQHLGFSGWEEFQALHRDWLTERNGGVYSGRAHRTLAGQPDNIIDRMATTEAENALSGLREDQRDQVNAAADLLAADGAVAVLGLRSCHSVAYALNYSLSLFRPDTRLIGADEGMLLDRLCMLSPGDALVSISVAPYSSETIAATRHARDAGLTVLALTDAPLGPLARLADITLTARNDGPAHLASVTGLMVLSQTLASLALIRRGEAGLAALRRYEATMAARSAFLPLET